MRLFKTYGFSGMHPVKMKYEGKKYTAVDISFRAPFELAQAIELAVKNKKIDDAALFIIDALVQQLKRKKIDSI